MREIAAKESAWWAGRERERLTSRLAISFLLFLLFSTKNFDTEISNDTLSFHSIYVPSLQVT